MTPTEARSLAPPVRRPAVRRRPWAPWIAAILEDWRRRWPAAFTRPVPLAVGISRQIKTALQAEGKAIERNAIGIVIHRWTMQSAYLRAMAQGAVRRNLDGSEAGIPDDAARQDAQKLLQERAARLAEKERRRQGKRAPPDGAGVGAVDAQPKSLV